MSGLGDPDFGDGKAGKPVKIPDRRPPVLAWTLVLAANLPVPLFFGILLSKDAVVPGKVGMACGVALIYGLGLLACRRAPAASFWVILGGWLVAASQIYPVLQVYAGSAGLHLAGLVAWGMTPENPVFQLIVFLVATLGTGAILLAVAAALGSFMWLADRRRPPGA